MIKKLHPSGIFHHMCTIPGVVARTSAWPRVPVWGRARWGVPWAAGAGPDTS